VGGSLLPKKLRLAQDFFKKFQSRMYIIDVRLLSDAKHSPVRRKSPAHLSRVGFRRHRTNPDPNPVMAPHGVLTWTTAKAKFAPDI